MPFAKTDTSDRVLGVCIRLFSEKGYDKVSVREIGEALRIKGSSMYNHMSTKSDLLDQVFVQIWRRRDLLLPGVDKVREMVQQGQPLREILEECFGPAGQDLPQYNRDLFRILQWELLCPDE